MSDPVPTGKNKAGANVLRATFVISLVCGGAIVLLLASDGALAGPSLHACLLVACVIFGVAGLHTKSTIGARNSLLYTHVGIGALWIAVSFVFIMFILNLYVPSALVDRKTWVGHSIDVYYNGVQAEESTNVTNVATTSMSSSLSKTTASSPATSFFFGATATTSSSAVSAFQSNLSETQQDAPSATITTDPTPAPTTASTDDPSNTETATPESLQAQDGSRMQRRDDWSSTHTETPFLLKALPPLLGINMLSLVN
ncbi:hypothetical protein DFJ73DRAFT_821058 [Zopfochytrium polystomum]|nr:hypothetical protein DFJ73DRAFT_821058 [Zopfochytrium polystomum]